MTEKEYNEAPGIRRSALWKLTKSPAHFKYELEHPPEPTPALIFGAAAHCAVLTPELYKEQFHVMNHDGRTKEGKQERQEALDAGQTILTVEQFEAIYGIVQSVKSNPYVMRLLDGPHETPYFWTDDITGEQCKCRLDAETDIGGQHIIVDFKTCMDASTNQFMRDAIRHGYHVQAAMYTEGKRLATGVESTFVFVAIEKEPPFALNILQCDEAFMLKGMDDYRYLCGLYHECKERNEWPGYTGFDGEINTLELPAWLKKEFE